MAEEVEIDEEVETIVITHCKHGRRFGQPCPECKALEEKLSFCSGTQWGDTITVPMKKLIPGWKDD